MESFLLSSREFVMQKLCQDSLSTQNKIHVVLGNEAADLDSVVSAIVYAYFLQNVQKTENYHFIPIVNCGRHDYILHTEVVFAFEKTSIDKDSLLFIDDLDLCAFKDRGILKGLTMVDHNVLAPTQRFMQDIIEKIIDHHKDDQRSIDQSKKVIEAVGSCCTLIAEQILRNMPSLLIPEISTLLVTTILVDTFDLPNVESRGTEKDKFIIKVLSKGLSKDSLEMYKSVHRARFDTSILNGYDLLRKDFKYMKKESVSIGISSVTTHIINLVSRQNFQQDLSLFCEERSLDALIIMCIEVTNEDDLSTTTRQMGIWGRNMLLSDHLMKQLSVNKQLKLELLNLPTCAVRCFLQENTSVSRKFALPILKDILSTFNV